MARAFKPYLKILVLNSSTAVYRITRRRRFICKRRPSAGLFIHISSFLFEPGIIIQAYRDRGIQNRRTASAKAFIKTATKPVSKLAKPLRNRKRCKTKQILYKIDGQRLYKYASFLYKGTRVYISDPAAGPLGPGARVALGLAWPWGSLGPGARLALGTSWP